MNHYVWDFGIILRYKWIFLSGLELTIFYTVVTTFIGTIFGAILAFASLSRFSVFRIIATAIQESFRCTPALVQIVWFYYALPMILGIEFTASFAAILMLSLYGGAFFAEIFRAGIQSVPQGQWEAARALGIKPVIMFGRVILPQAATVIIPPYMSQCILQLKNTSLVSFIAVPDLLYQGTIVTNDTYRPIEVYTTIAVIYFVVLFPATRLVKYLEGRFKRGRSGQ